MYVSVWLPFRMPYSIYSCQATISISTIESSHNTCLRCVGRRSNIALHRQRWRICYFFFIWHCDYTNGERKYALIHEFSWSGKSRRIPKNIKKIQNKENNCGVYIIHYIHIPPHIPIWIVAIWTISNLPLMSTFLVCDSCAMTVACYLCASLLHALLQYWQTVLRICHRHSVTTELFTLNVV